MTTDTIALLKSLAQPVTRTLSGMPVAFDAEAQTISMTFRTTKDFAHTNGTIVQGGFVTAMLDMTMAHLVMGLTDAKSNPISLDINTSFIAPCPVGAQVCNARVIKLGRSIGFLAADLYAEDSLIASATSTVKLVPTGL
jgi:acyl-CoA thioesterase